MLQRCNNCVDGKNLEVEIKSDHATDIRETTNHETDEKKRGDLVPIFCKQHGTKNGLQKRLAHT